MERIVIKFTKKDNCEFISHLDLIRTFQRAMKRANVPVSYSKGYNPHISISLAAPLSLGVSSTAEYADLEIENYMDPAELKEVLSNTLPEGIRITKAIRITEKISSSAALVEGAEYNITIHHNINYDELYNVIKSILADEKIEKLKKSKSGDKIVNVRPFVKDLILKDYCGDSAEICCFLYTGSKGGVNPEIILELLKERSNNSLSDYAKIERQELFVIRNNEWVPLDKLFSGK